MGFKCLYCGKECLDSWAAFRALDGSGFVCSSCDLSDDATPPPGFELVPSSKCDGCGCDLKGVVSYGSSVGGQWCDGCAPGSLKMMFEQGLRAGRPSRRGVTRTDRRALRKAERRRRRR